MSTRYASLSGNEIGANELTLDKARRLAEALSRNTIDCAQIVEARNGDDSETVVFDVTVERPQICAYSIERTERISATFYTGDTRQPEVLALRLDFPSVPHLNLRSQEIPRSLCLYQESYRDQKRHWTVARFVARIREWLALTAEGVLHEDDQPLEPILFGPDSIFLVPPDISPNQIEKPFRIIPLISTAGANESGHALCIAYTCEPKTHGVIQHRPKTLANLAAMVDSAFLPTIRKLLWDQADKHEEFLSANIVLVVVFPKTRTPGGEPESFERWAFQTRILGTDGKTSPAPIRDIGEAIGVWTKRDSTVSLCLPKPDTSLQGTTIILDIMNVVEEMNAQTLARLNNRDSKFNPKICAVGVGALGSQVVLNLARAGFGEWTLVDHDLLLPHNVARHVLPGGDVIGRKKALSVSDFANSLTVGKNLFKPIIADVFTPASYEDWSSPSFVDTPQPVAEARSNTSGLTLPM